MASAGRLGANVSKTSRNSQRVRECAYESRREVAPCRTESFVTELDDHIYDAFL